MVITRGRDVSNPVLCSISMVSVRSIMSAEAQTRQSSFARPTKQSKVLIKNYGNLKRAMTDPGPGSLALDLVPTGLISESTLQKIHTPGNAPSTQAYYLLRDLKRTMMRDSKNFYKLIQILSDASPALDAVAKLMKKDYGKPHLIANQPLHSIIKQILKIKK